MHHSANMNMKIQRWTNCNWVHLSIAQQSVALIMIITWFLEGGLNALMSLVANAFGGQFWVDASSLISNFTYHSAAGINLNSSES